MLNKAVSGRHILKDLAATRKLLIKSHDQYTTIAPAVVVFVALFLLRFLPHHRLDLHAQGLR
jgi:hypothetical protein